MAALGWICLSARPASAQLGGLVVSVTSPASGSTVSGTIMVRASVKGLDLVGDGTFWAVNSVRSNVYKFDLETGAVLAGFNSGTGDWSAIGVGVKP
jgi:hypothetical protein